MATFQVGEPVALRESAAPTMGRVVSVRADGRRVEVRWQKRPGYDRQVTVDDVGDLRLLHESEGGKL